MIGLAVFGLLAMMGVFRTEFVLEVQEVRRDGSVCGLRRDSTESEGLRCISPSSYFDSNKAIVKALEVGDCVVYTGGHGGIRLEREVACDDT